MELGSIKDEHIDEISKHAGAENMDVQKDIRERVEDAIKELMKK